MSRRPGPDPLALVRSLFAAGPRECPPLLAPGVRMVLCEGAKPPRVLGTIEAEDYVAHGLP